MTFNGLTWTVCGALFMTAQAEGAIVKSRKDLKFPPMKSIVLPQPERVTLSNGMTVFLLEDHGLPVTKAAGRLRTGSWWEPGDKLGVASVMADVLRTGGTATMTGDQVDDTLEGLVASIEVAIELTTLTTKMFSLKDDAPRVLGLMADMFRQPAFDPKKIDLKKIQLHDAISRRNDALGDILRREMRPVLFGRDNPMTRVMEHHHVDRITRNDVMAFYRQTVSPDRMMLSVWGDFQSAEMKALLEKTFGSWKPSQELMAVSLPSLQTPPTPARVWLVNRPDAAQTHVRFAHIGGFLKDPETPALEVANEIFGGGMASRLFTHIRTERGLAYSVGSGWSTGFLVPGVFVMAGETKGETTGQFIEAIRKELAAYLAEGPTEEEVQHAKQALLDALPFHFEDPGAVLDRVMTYEYFGYPKNFFTTYMDRLKEVTREEVKQALGQKWKPELLHLFVLGHPEKFDKPLSTYGEVTPIDITIPPPSPHRP